LAAQQQGGFIQHTEPKPTFTGGWLVEVNPTSQKLTPGTKRRQAA